MKEFEKIEEEARKKLKSQKPKMKISGRSNFLLAKISGRTDKKNDKKI